MTGLILLLLLLCPQLAIQTKPPIQGVWVEWYGHQATVQSGLGNRLAIMLYHPARTFPTAVYLDSSGKWNWQLGSN